MDVKKLNKRERKEARQQKNKNNVNAAENTHVHEPEEPEAGKKKKKEKKRKRDGSEERNGHGMAENGTSSKKSKGKSDIFLKAVTSLQNQRFKLTLTFLFPGADSTEDADLNMSEETNNQAVSKGKYGFVHAHVCF